VVVSNRSHRVSVAFPRKQLEASSLHPTLPFLSFPHCDLETFCSPSFLCPRRSLFTLRLHSSSSNPPKGRHLEPCKEHRPNSVKAHLSWKGCPQGTAHGAVVLKMKASPLLISWHNDNAPIYSVHFDPNGKGRLATAGNDNNVRVCIRPHRPTQQTPRLTPYSYGDLNLPARNARSTT
jgi:hypothetical protein